MTEDENNEQIEQYHAFMRYLLDLGLELEMIKSYCESVEEYLRWQAKNKTTPFSRMGPVEARNEVDEFLASCAGREIEIQGIPVMLTAITTYFDYLVSYQFILKNPLTSFPPPDTSPFTCLEMFKLLKACDITTTPGLRDAALLVLAAVAGLTPDEIISFSIEQVSRRQRRKVRLHIRETESRHRRDIWLWNAPAYVVAEQTRARLDQHAELTDSLLVSYKHRGGCKLTLDAVDSIVKRIARSADIRGLVTADQLRFTHFTHDDQDLRSMRISIGGK